MHRFLCLRLSIALLSLSLAQGCETRVLDQDSDSSTSGSQDTGAADSILDLRSAALDVAVQPDLLSPLHRVKIALVLDISSSSQFGDPVGSNGKTGLQLAVQELVDSLHANRYVEFSIARYNSLVQVTGGGGFTKNMTLLQEAIDSLPKRDLFSDYQSAIFSTRAMIEKDIQDTPAENRPFTKYVVVFMAESLPNPICTEGCDNDFIMPQALSWCDIPRVNWCGTFNYPKEQCDTAIYWFPAMTDPCLAYNQDSQLLDQVAALMNLSQQVGQIRFNTFFLSSLKDLDPQLQELSGYDHAKTEATLESLAAAGQGQYLEFSKPADIDLSVFDYSPVNL